MLQSAGLPAHQGQDQTALYCYLLTGTGTQSTAAGAGLTRELILCRSLPVPLNGYRGPSAGSLRDCRGGMSDWVFIQCDAMQQRWLLHYGNRSTGVQAITEPDLFIQAPDSRSRSADHREPEQAHFTPAIHKLEAGP